MIDTDNLRTASLYINNQLLSRGLLRDGQSIDFADPAVGDGDVAATMGRIMSVVNDLILRRDRDAEHRESLSATMRTLRAENLKHANDIVRLTEKHVEVRRKLDIAEASEASLRTQMKSADAAVRGLKEEVARTKSMVAQARATCATEVRRRDRQIDTLKKQLGEAGRARGSRGNPSVTTITVTGDVGEGRTSPMQGVSIASDDYNLRSETNEFLAKLAQSLSEENEAILGVMRRTMQQLRNMSGWNASGDEYSLIVRQQGWEEIVMELDSVLNHMRTILTNPSFVPIEEVMVREEEINRLKDGWVKMENRWTEAVHLIDGWRKRMAASGRPVCEEELQMGLRLSPVRVKDVEETRQGLALRLSAVAEEQEPEEEPVLLQSPCLQSRGSPDMRDADDWDQAYDQAYDQPEESDDESHFDDHIPIEDYDVEEPNVQILQQSTTGVFPPILESSPLPEPPQLSPLRDSASAGNRGSLKLDRPMKKLGDFTTITEENTWDLAGDASPLKPSPLITRASAPRSRPGTGKSSFSSIRDRTPSASSLDEVLLVRSPHDPPSRTTNDSPKSRSHRRQKTPDQVTTDSCRRSGPQNETPNCSPRRNAASRLPLPRNVEAPQQSPLTMATIAAKLAASEREADAARVRAKLKAARGPRGVKKPTLAPSQPSPPEPAKPTVREVKSNGVLLDDVDPVKHDPLPADDQLRPEKRRRDRRTSKVASRRRSTLSPWELESLITGNVQ